MYASSSRILLQSSLQSTSRSFSASVPSAARRETFVELLQDVPGLGRTFDRLFVAPGRARNDLVPTRKARFVPFKDNSQRQIYRATDIDRASHTNPLIEPPSSSSSSSAYTSQSKFYSASEITETPQELLNTLHLLPSQITFHKRTISPDYPSLHGSLTLSEISDKLENEYGLSSKDIELNWLSTDDTTSFRIKELGQYNLNVQLKKGGRESNVVQVGVERLEDGDN